jgi:hypothetical protein
MTNSKQNLAYISIAKRPHALQKIMMISAFAFFGLFACTEVDQARPQTLDFAEAPKGAIAPAGVNLIREGMTQKEVLAILGPIYPVIHAPAEDLKSPIANAFPYSEGGATKYIEIYYDSYGKVSLLRFGYQEFSEVE